MTSYSSVAIQLVAQLVIKIVLQRTNILCTNALREEFKNRAM
jgi:hypothetical protein